MVKRLRDALGDSAEAPRFVETLSRRGYRFIAPVESPDDRVVSATRLAEWRSQPIMVLAAGLAALFLTRALRSKASD